MTRVLYVAVAVAAIGCGRKSSDSAATQSNERAREGRDQQTAGTPLAEQRPSTGGNAAAQQRVQLTGCLQGEGANPTSPNVRPELPANRAADANGSGSDCAAQRPSQETPALAQMALADPEGHWSAVPPITCWRATSAS